MWSEVVYTISDVQKIFNSSSLTGRVEVAFKRRNQILKSDKTYSRAIVSPNYQNTLRTSFMPMPRHADGCFTGGRVLINGFCERPPQTGYQYHPILQKEQAMNGRGGMASVDDLSFCVITRSFNELLL